VRLANRGPSDFPKIVPGAIFAWTIILPFDMNPT
jgi:hypothetical protein